MDLSLLENFQKLVATSLQSIIEDLKTQYENQKEELGDRIVDLTIKVKEQEKEITEMREKIEESNFNDIQSLIDDGSVIFLENKWQ